ncbi:DUF2950 family protein [Meridianimarinicoccus aquatilis]|uniref:DUF2950 family protein n=1 Tax=Meridianimarinicoccus aquatilis TaxID=2552766 RepID=A0A4R6AR01_9RHOB|nr:DUF2950 family protein [Fluviibacterium aquatile]TDL86921.1 DUF2950 family protein [Fluviibacterium aquatile]
MTGIFQVVRLVCASTVLTTTSAFAEPANFPTPQDALEGFVAALNTPIGGGGILAVLGEDARDIVDTGDKNQNAANRAEMLELYAEGYRFLPDGDGRVTILFGAESWPFPIPIVRSEGVWHFDVDAGREELAAREIGLNELEVMDLLRAYVAVQADYRSVDHDGDGVMEFASHILSTEPGKRDGLFWMGAQSPMGARIARAAFEGYSDGNTDFPPEPLHGYYFQMLNAQGSNAPGGEMTYLVNGNQVSGHAMMAVPAAYGQTGINTFLISENGVLLQTDLGEETLAIAARIDAFDPGPDWVPAD